MRKILVLRGGALGDFIVTLPALALLQRRWPDAKLELVGNATAATLVRAGGLLDAVHSQHEARWSALFSPAPLAPDFAGWLASFDLVVSYWPDPDGELRRRFPVRGGQSYLTASALPERAPAAAHYCDPLKALGLETATYFCGLEGGYLVPGAAPAVPELSAREVVVALHPGSGSPKKNWPLERWTALAQWLRRVQPAVQLLIVAGEAEPDGLLSEHGRVARSLPLPILAAELSRCRLFVGHDSGVSHLAAACGVRCILLFGPTDPAVWAPPAPHVQVIRHGPELGSISVVAVQEAVSAVLADRK